MTVTTKEQVEKITDSYIAVREAILKESPILKLIINRVDEIVTTLIDIAKEKARLDSVADYELIFANKASTSYSDFITCPDASKMVYALKEKMAMELGVQMLQKGYIKFDEIKNFETMRVNYQAFVCAKGIKEIDE